MTPNLAKPGFLPVLFKRLPLLVLLLLVVLVAALATCVSHKAGQLEKERSTAMAAQDPGVNVVVLILSPSKIKDRINLPGMTIPWVRLPVSAEVSGKVSRKLAEEGRTVREGDALCHLDDRDYRNHFNATRAAFDTANADHARVLKLYGEQVASRSLLDSAVAELERSRSAMHMANLQLERCHIKAGMDGIINRMLVEPGQYVAVGDPVAEILQLNPIKVIVGIPESDIHAVRQVDTFEICIEALGGKTFTGTKHHFSRSAGPLAKLYDLEIRIDNPEGEILADMFARVDIVKRSSPLALSVPLYGVISTGGNHTVFVDAGGHAEKREVTLGIQEGWRIEITSGLGAGDRVVVVGQRDLVQGQKINIIKKINDIKEL